MKRKKKRRARQAAMKVAPVVKAARKRPDENPRRIFMKQCLREWGAWRRAWHCGPGRVQSWWGKLWLEQFMPLRQPLPDREVNEDRAQEIHGVIDGLDPLLRLVLLMQYVLGVHSTKEEKARACGLASPQRFYEALGRAHDGFEIRLTLLGENILGAEKYLQKPTCGAGLDPEIIDIVV